MEVSKIIEPTPENFHTMTNTEADVAEFGEVLTLDEIYGRYPDEWVLIVCPQLDQNLNVIRGAVIAHSPDRDEVYKKFGLRKGKPVAIEYTGSMDDDIAVML